MNENGDSHRKRLRVQNMKKDMLDAISDSICECLCTDYKGFKSGDIEQAVADGTLSMEEIFGVVRKMVLAPRL